VVGEITFQKKLGFLERGGDIDGMMESNDGFLAYASVCGQIPEAHSFLLGNPVLPYLLPVSSTEAQFGNNSKKCAYSFLAD
jgi:hypothetical protein